MGQKYRGILPPKPPKLPLKWGFSMLNSNAAADLDVQYVKRRGFTQGRILLGMKYMGHKFRGTLPPKSAKLPPEIWLFHVKFKGGGRFGRAVRQKTWFHAGMNTFGYEIHGTQI